MAPAPQRSRVFVLNIINATDSALEAQHPSIEKWNPQLFLTTGSSSQVAFETPKKSKAVAPITVVFPDKKSSVQLRPSRRWFRGSDRKAPARERKMQVLNLEGESGEKYLAVVKATGIDTADLSILEVRQMNNWMSSIPDQTMLNDVYIPGTHESLALYGWPISQCQEWQSMTQQLQDGIRFFDLRFAIKDNVLIAYHGIQSEQIPAIDVFNEIYKFQDENPSETFFVSIKQEDAAEGFSELVRSIIWPRSDRWFLEDRMPTLGEARGRAILFTRFGGGLNVGIRPTTWPNNDPNGFSWTLGDITVNTQDWYDIGSVLAIPDKFTKIANLLSHPTGSGPSWNINFTSCGSLALAFPFVCAKGIGFPPCLKVEGLNSRLLTYLTDPGTVKAKGVLMMDFYGYPSGALVPLIVGFNFAGPKGAFFQSTSVEKHTLDGTPSPLPVLPTR